MHTRTYKGNCQLLSDYHWTVLKLQVNIYESTNTRGTNQIKLSDFESKPPKISALAVRSSSTDNKDQYTSPSIGLSYYCTLTHVTADDKLGHRLPDWNNKKHILSGNKRNKQLNIATSLSSKFPTSLTPTTCPLIINSAPAFKTINTYFKKFCSLKTR